MIQKGRHAGPTISCPAVRAHPTSLMPMQASFMPILVLAARLCPEGVEATLFATLMSILNGKKALRWPSSALAGTHPHSHARAYIHAAVYVLCGGPHTQLVGYLWPHALEGTQITRLVPTQAWELAPHIFKCPMLLPCQGSLGADVVWKGSHCR